MTATGLLRAATFAGLTLALAGCAGPHGIHGDVGLEPTPQNIPYPNVYRTEPDNHHALKSQAEQKQLQADLQAHKPQRAAPKKRKAQ